MREIKFRAWDKLNKKWLSTDIGTDDFPILLAVGLHGLPIAIDKDSYRKGEIVGWNRDHNIELSQYTGLKDKNGVEIYEGDIVRDILGWEIEVKWFDRHTGFIPFAGGCGEQLSEMCEVIGNIYENPGLLK